MRGRPYGGLAFLFHEKIAPHVQPIPTSDERILCIDININDNCIRLINCYMPYYNGTNFDEYVNILGKINCLFNEHSNKYVIALGDFNAHPSGEFGRELLVNTTIV